MEDSIDSSDEEIILDESITISDIVEEDINLSELDDESEGEFGLLSISPFIRDYKIPTSVWNIKSKGKYEFSGSSNSKKLYTKYRFKGKTKYTVNVKNNSGNAITVKALRENKTYAMLLIGKGKSTTFNVSDIKSTTKFYLSFDYPGKPVKISGYVK